jgi:hypothetical protein
MTVHQLNAPESIRRLAFWISLLILTLVVALTGWLYLVHLGIAPDGTGLCSTGDTDFIDCVRNWIDPVAAVFTIAAIVYAALQYREATRASDAAVRASLVRLRDDLESDYEPIATMMREFFDVQRELQLFGISGMPDEVPLNILANMHDHSEGLYNRVQRVLGRQSYVEELNTRRNATAKALVSFYNSIWQSSLHPKVRIGEMSVQEFLKRKWPKIRPEFEDANQRLYEFSRRLRDEINTVTGTIAQFDEAVLRNARQTADVRREEYLQAIRKSAAAGASLVERVEAAKKAQQ